MNMVSIRDSDSQKMVDMAAEELKQKIQMPGWARYVKTGVSKERPPENSNWWYVRAASMMRRLYIDGPVGVSRLRTYYGGLHRRGHKPAHFARGGGKVIRTLLIDLEKAGLVEKVKKDKVITGRILTKEGIKLMNAASKRAK